MKKNIVMVALAALFVVPAFAQKTKATVAFANPAGVDEVEITVEDGRLVAVRGFVRGCDVGTETIELGVSETKTFHSQGNEDGQSACLQSVVLRRIANGSILLDLTIGKTHEHDLVACGLDMDPTPEDCPIFDYSLHSAVIKDSIDWK